MTWRNLPGIKMIHIWKCGGSLIKPSVPMAVLASSTRHFWLRLEGTKPCMGTCPSSGWHPRLNTSPPSGSAKRRVVAWAETPSQPSRHLRNPRASKRKQVCGSVAYDDRPAHLLFHQYTEQRNFHGN